MLGGVGLKEVWCVCWGGGVEGGGVCFFWGGVKGGVVCVGF